MGGVVIGRIGLQLECHIHGACVLHKARLEVVIFVDGGAVAAWVGRFRPFKAFACRIFQVGHTPVTKQHVIAVLTQNAVVTRPAKDGVIAFASQNRVVPAARQNDIVVRSDISKDGVVRIHAVPVGVARVGQVDQIIIAGTINDTILASRGWCWCRACLCAETKINQAAKKKCHLVVSKVWLGALGLSCPPRICDRPGHRAKRIQFKPRRAPPLISCRDRGKLPPPLVNGLNKSTGCNRANRRAIYVPWTRLMGKTCGFVLTRMG